MSAIALRVLPTDEDAKIIGERLGRLIVWHTEFFVDSILHGEEGNVMADLCNAMQNATQDFIEPSQ